MDVPDIPLWPDDEVCPFLAAMRANPDDETAALVFADWLDEHCDPRAGMIRASCRASGAPWLPLYDDLLGAWVGPMDECYFWVGGLIGGLLSLSINNYRGSLRVKKSEYPRFFAAHRQGWVGRVHFGGLPSAIFEQTSLLRSLVLEAPRLEVYAATQEASDDDLARVRELPNLVELAVEEFRGFTDAGLAHLRNHPRLERVVLSGEFSPEGYEHLRTLSQLRYPNLSKLR